MCTTVHCWLTLGHRVGNHQLLRRNLCDTPVKKKTAEMERTATDGGWKSTISNSQASHLSCCAVIRAVWRASLLVFQESSEGKVTVAVLIRHPNRLSPLFLVGASRTGHSHWHVALCLDQGNPASTFPISSSGVSSVAGRAKFGCLMFRTRAVVEGQVYGHGSESLEMVIEHLQTTTAAGPSSRNLRRFNTAWSLSPLSGNLTMVKQLYNVRSEIIHFH